LFGAAPAPLRVGDITLHPHQRSAAARIRRQIARHGGALLCDEVGLGKTYVALAVAQSFADVTVIAPASLAGMWRQATRATRTPAEFISIETLGRAGPNPRHRSLMIVDEAHHFRNPSTRRYSALAKLCATTPVLLLTATPLHNSRDDMSALAALFLGTRAYALGPAELAQLVVRRREPETGMAIPIVHHAAPEIVLNDETVLDTILALPPAVAPSDGSLATSLVIHGLVRQWVSSHAALAGALRRRLGRSHGLLASLEAGRYPTAAELSAWVYADQCVQLAFTELQPPAKAPLETLSSALHAHTRALSELLSIIRPLNDDSLADFVRSVRCRHPGEKIVAFTSYAETAESVYRSLRSEGHAALLTARGAIIASGPIPRDQLLGQFAPAQPFAHAVESHRDVTLLISTDLLSEGVNLQQASVVINLDLPWTEARLQQRVGRLARIGSPHPRVTCYTVNPPPRAEAVLHELEIIARKSEASTRLLGASAVDAQCGGKVPGGIAGQEATAKIIEQWYFAEAPGLGIPEPSSDAQPDPDSLVAFVSTRRPGAIGVWMVDGCPMLLALDETSRLTTDHATVLNAARVADQSADADLETSFARIGFVMKAAANWYRLRQARAAVGVPADAVALDGAIPKRTRHDLRRSIARVADAAGARATFATRARSAEIATRIRGAAATPLPLAVEWALQSIPENADDSAVTTILELVDHARQRSDTPREPGMKCAALVVFVPENSASS
jgi:hypothetical protein